MLHPQVRALLDFSETSGAPALHTLSVAEARASIRSRIELMQPAPEEVSEVRDIEASGPNGPIPLRLYRPFRAPAAKRVPTLVYYHGGGWTIGDLDTHDALCRELSNAAHCAVVAADYRLGPEHPFPAAVVDSIAATRWIYAHAEELDLDAQRLAVGGDSAGGNLAAVVSIDARERGDLPLVFQLLIYPATDMHCATPSHVENAQGYFLTRDSLDYFLGHYIPDRASYDDWRASPLLHSDLSKLPAALIITAAFDPLRDEGAAYAQKLTAAGTSASYVCFPRQIHGFISMGKVLDEARTAVALCAAELRRAFALR